MFQPHCCRSSFLQSFSKLSSHRLRPCQVRGPGPLSRNLLSAPVSPRRQASLRRGVLLTVFASSAFWDSEGHGRRLAIESSDIRSPPLLGGPPSDSSLIILTDFSQGCMITVMGKVHINWLCEVPEWDLTNTSLVLEVSCPNCFTQTFKNQFMSVVMVMSRLTSANLKYVYEHVPTQYRLYSLASSLMNDASILDFIPSIHQLAIL